MTNGRFHPRRIVARAPRLPLVAVAALLGTGIAPRASAAPDEATMARARVYFEKGQEAYDAGRYADAIASYQAGYKLSGKPGFLYNMGQAARAMGDPRGARGYYLRYLSADPQSPRHDEVVGHIAEIDRELRGEAPPSPAPRSPPPAPPPAPARIAPPPAFTPPPAPPPALAPPPAPAAGEPVEIAPASPRPRDDTELPTDLPAGAKSHLPGVARRAPAPRPAASGGPFYTRWWFWTLVAAGAAGAAAGVVIAGQGSAPPFHKAGSWGHIP